VSDRNRHWREAIGVVPGRATPTRRPESDAGDDDAAKGPATVREVAPPRTSRTERIVATRPSQRAAEAEDADTGAHGETDLTARLLGQLSVGSLGFADEVSRMLWASPTPDDLRALTAIASERHRIEDDALVQATLRAVTVRHRAERLARSLARPVLDASVIQARAVEWGRLARLAHELATTLRNVDEDTAGRDVVEAAAKLLPRPLDLDADSMLTAETANIVDVLASDDARAVTSAASRCGDLERLVNAVREQRLEPGDGLNLEILAAGCLVRRALQGGEIDASKRARRAILRVTERAEASVTEAARAHVRDAAGNVRRAAWMRFLREARSAVEDTLTKPSEAPLEDDTAPTGAQREPRPTYEDQDEERIIEALRTARTARDNPLARRLEAASDETAPSGAVAAPAEPGAARGTPLWLVVLVAVGLVATVALWASRVVLPEPLPAARAVPAELVSRGALTGAGSVGAMLVATADPTWTRFGPEERELAAGRLMSAAEAAGFRAGIVLAPTGQPLAWWWPGQAPVLAEDRP
jgi:hypothetical protein